MASQLLGQNVPNWNGAMQTLAQYDYVTMPQTPNGSLVLAYWNRSTLNNFGKIAVSSGGTTVFLDVPPLANQPSLLVRNFGASDLKITNYSPNASTPITVLAAGPGIPGLTPGKLPIGTPPTQIVTLQTLVGPTQPNSMALQMTSNTNNLSILVVVGGPGDGSGNNASVFALNCPTASPPGYTAAVSGNSYTYGFNWGGSSLFVANMSPATAASVQVLLLSI